MHAHATKYVNGHCNYYYLMNVGSLHRLPQVVLMKPYSPLMFQIHMHMPLLAPKLNPAKIIRNKYLNHSLSSYSLITYFRQGIIMQHCDFVFFFVQCPFSTVKLKKTIIAVIYSAFSIDATKISVLLLS